MKKPPGGVSMDVFDPKSGVQMQVPSRVEEWWQVTVKIMAVVVGAVS